MFWVGFGVAFIVCAGLFGGFVVIAAGKLNKQDNDNHPME